MREPRQPSYRLRRYYFQERPYGAIADDNADCADYVDRDHEVDPLDGASIANTADDSTDERIANKVDDMAVAESNYKWDAAVSELMERSAVAAGPVRTDTAGRKPD